MGSGEERLAGKAGAAASAAEEEEEKEGAEPRGREGGREGRHLQRRWAQGSLSGAAGGPPLQPARLWDAGLDQAPACSLRGAGSLWLQGRGCGSLISAWQLWREKVSRRGS